MPDFSYITVSKTRKTLIERCMKDDPEAWEAFYAPYRDYARNIIRYKYFDLSQTELDELAHEVMIKVSGSIRNFDPDTPSRHKPGEKAKFRAWFCNQIRTVLRTYFRNRQKNREIFEFDPELDADLAEFDAKFHEEREQAILAKAMELLTQSRANRRTIEAYQMQLNDRAVADIAEELGMTENSVHQAVCRCRRFLEEHRRELEELF